MLRSPQARFSEVLCSSSGYNSGGRDHGVIDILPQQLDPRIGVDAANAAATSMTFVGALESVVTINTKAEDRTGKDWLSIFGLLANQCTASEAVKREIERAEERAKNAFEVGKANIENDFGAIVPMGDMLKKIRGEEGDYVEEEEEEEEEEDEEEVKEEKMEAEELMVEENDDAMVVEAVVMAEGEDAGAEDIQMVEAFVMEEGEGVIAVEAVEESVPMQMDDMKKKGKNPFKVDDIVEHREVRESEKRRLERSES